MKTRARNLLMAVLLLACTTSVMTGCVMNSTVTIDSEPQGAEVRLDNRVVGTTPVTVRLSNALWENPVVRIRADGYRDIYGGLQMEIKGPNLIVGFLLFWPALLWSYGPDQYQYFDLIEE